MMASNFEFFPCRVKLLGLPPSPGTVAAANISPRPTVDQIHKVSRNLFGSPDPDDMEKLFLKEEERIRSYALQRYNFDLEELKTMNKEERELPLYKNHTSHTLNSEKCFPNLIEEELKHHDKRLNNETKSLSSSLLKTNKLIFVSANSSIKVSPRCKASKNLLLPVFKHQKQHCRQPSLKECFKIRKNQECKQSGGQLANLE